MPKSMMLVFVRIRKNFPTEKKNGKTNNMKVSIYPT